MKTALLFVHALSPLHAGTGQGVGAIDLPTAREKATGLPYLPGSSLKGALRDLCDNDADRHAIFGPETEQADDRAGAAQFGDARLLLLPVRSLGGTFAWVTSPYVLDRFARDASDAGAPEVPSVIPEPQQTGCMVAEGSVLGVARNGGRRVYLEDLDLDLPENADATWATWLGKRLFPAHERWRTLLTQRFCVVHDEIMSFLLETALEVVARIRLEDESKTVKRGGLWYEESLPTETVLQGLLLTGPELRSRSRGEGALKSAEQVLQTLAGLAAHRPLQLGGKATVGRGLCRIALVEGR